MLADNLYEIYFLLRQYPTLANTVSYSLENGSLGFLCQRSFIFSPFVGSFKLINCPKFFGFYFVLFILFYFIFHHYNVIFAAPLTDKRKQTRFYFLKCCLNLHVVTSFYPFFQYKTWSVPQKVSHCTALCHHLHGKVLLSLVYSIVCFTRPVLLWTLPHK